MSHNLKSLLINNNEMKLKAKQMCCFTLSSWDVKIALLSLYFVTRFAIKSDLRCISNITFCSFCVTTESWIIVEFLLSSWTQLRSSLTLANCNFHTDFTALRLRNPLWDWLIAQCAVVNLRVLESWQMVRIRVDFKEVWSWESLVSVHPDPSTLGRFSFNTRRSFRCVFVYVPIPWCPDVNVSNVRVHTFL